MKFIKWKSLIITCLVCLLPILLGVVLWEDLPDNIAIHFNFYNEPDNFAPKGFTVFGLPLLMVLLQVICCIINDVNAKKYGERKKFERATKWIIPIMSILLQTITLTYAIGMSIDIRKAAILIVGIIFLVIGNYLPKFDYVKNYDIETDKARKINRFIGNLTVLWGFFAIVTIFLPPLVTVIWLFSLIPYGIVSAVFSIKTIKSSQK